MPLRFLLDEHLRGLLWRAILRHNAAGHHPLDVLRVGDPADLPLGTLDPALLLWIEREQRILLTLDHDTMPGHLTDHLQQGHHVLGIFIIKRQSSIPDVVDYLVLAAHAGNPDDYRDQVNFIP
jgi:hypothetical protein